MSLFELFAQVDAILSPQIKSRNEIQEHIFDLTRKTGRTDVDRWDPDEYKRKWLASQNFFLMQVPFEKFNDVRPPHNPEIVEKKVQQVDTEPVVIDKNTPANYVTERKPKPWPGPHLVMDGAHRVQSWKKLGWKTFPAWVGEKVISELI